ncbi:MarR family winged helix-turn-helix transcriptional regulator [Wenjunlia tyrosinilytica]|jgi:DNA-binding MarR family transcriptional regulator|uniref:MarR family transcriptional regulator n=1 Tax=Wenjunlia tyrosinilytica TaxID=1544741 RepID=A0A917ZM55_9ACTN|nr:MarR family transcriptional regulator [Wenjunlia tyrosinilytica]GGO85688.1 MarR family transcriptional regulator [Wenjunlia tyrosinilytica]
MGNEQEQVRPADIADDEVITWWGLAVEGYTRTNRLTATDLGVDVTVPGPWFEVLLRLLRTPGHRLTMTRLAHEVSLTSGGFTKFADRMVKAGLIERQACATDRRVTYVALTPSGLSIAERARARHAEALRRYFLEPLGVADAERLSALMRRLRDANTPELKD